MSKTSSPTADSPANIGGAAQSPAAAPVNGHLPAAAKVELYRAFRESGMRKADLARRLKIAKGNIDRLFDLDHHSRLDLMEAAFRAIGKDLHVEVRDAA